MCSVSQKRGLSVRQVSNCLGIKCSNRAEEMAQQSRVIMALVEDPGLLLRTQWHHTAACNFNLRLPTSNC